MKWRLEMKNPRLHREADHPSSTKALMTTPPMTQHEYDRIKQRQRQTRRLLEEAQDERELRHATSGYVA